MFSSFKQLEDYVGSLFKHIKQFDVNTREVKTWVAEIGYIFLKIIFKK